jgi:CheY-like chemotaxis protein/MinD-like ATPase involved in chromosome partitioning or flagellar assembly
MPRALVIDDEDSLNLIVGRLLEGAGFEVETAVSGLEGLRKAVSVPPDVAIVDIMMPEMDGYEVCRRLRRDPRTARAAILVLTARGQLIDKKVALRSGADAHLTKPFEGKHLVQEVHRLLAEKTPTDPPLGYQILVLRLKAGAGATTLAINLALCLAQEEGRLAIVADMALEGGQVENRLGLPLTKSWQDTSGDVGELVDLLVRHDSGLFALPSPPPKEEPAPPERVAQVLQHLRAWFDYVVVDTAFNLGALTPVLLKSSPLVLLLLTPEPANLQAAQASLDAIRRLGSRALQIWPVLRLASAEEGAQQRVEEALGLPVAAVLPWSPQECARAVADCEPVLLSSPDSGLAAAYRRLAQKAIGNMQEQPLRRIPR